MLICKPGTYGRVFTARNINIMFIGICLLSVLQAVPAITGTWGKLGFDEITQRCTILPSNGKSSKLTIYAVNISIPCIVMIYCYCCIYKTVRRTDSPKSITLKGSWKLSSIINLNKNKNFSMVIIMLAIFLTFTICYFPYLILILSHSIQKKPVLFSIFNLLHFAHIFTIPFILFSTNKLYNVALKQKIHPHSNFQTQNNIDSIITV